MVWSKILGKPLRCIVLAVGLLLPEGGVFSAWVPLPRKTSTNVMHQKAFREYLTEVGPVPIRYAEPERAFNRLNLIPNEQPVHEEVPRKDIAKSVNSEPMLKATYVEPESIDPLNSYNAIDADSLEFLESDVGPISDPDEILLFLEKNVNSNKTETDHKVVLPFQLPFQNGSSRLPPPSKAIYERT